MKSVATSIYLLIIIVEQCELTLIPSSHRRRSTHSNESERFIGFNFTEEPSNNVHINGELHVNCRYSVHSASINDVRTEWLKDSTPLAQQRLYDRITLINDSLIFKNFGTVDDGVYQCAIHVIDRNYFKWIFLSRKALLKVHDHSRLEVQPADLTVYRGESVAFSCVPRPSPQTFITWYHNNVIINGTVGSTIIYPVTSTLEVSNVGFEHKGSYKCEVNIHGGVRTSRVANLKIFHENAVENEFSEPKFMLKPQSEAVDEDSSIVLECLVNGWPKASVKWLFGSETLSPDGERIHRLGLSSLLILKASVKDDGVYTCRASNSQDSIDASATIRVKAAPVISLKPTSVIARETSDVDFLCEAVGRPYPVIHWYKNGENIVPSDYFMIVGNQLRVLGLIRTDQAAYQCIAENEAGSAQAHAQLVVDSAGIFSISASNGKPKLPSEPLGVRLSAVGSRFVTLAWDPPVQRYGYISSYHIFYKDLNSDRERMTNSSYNTVTVTQLQPNTAYMFRVVAENEAGVGRSSIYLSVNTTKEQAVPGKVKNLRAVALTAETIEVSWLPPNGNGPDAAQYKLFYIRKDQQSTEKETQIMTDMTSYTLRGMEKYENYTIRVEAVGKDGAGLSSEPIIVRTLSDIPSAPPSDIRGEAISSTSIQIQWAPPPLNECNGVITGYRIKYRTKMRGTRGNTMVVDGSDQSLTVSGLEPATSYVFRVSAVNQNGSGVFSEPLTVETSQEGKDEGQVAGPPMSLKVHAATDSIQLSWLPPKDESIMIRGYLIGWGIGIPDVEQVTVDAKTRHYTIKGLKPGRDYVISLRACNSVGNGFPIYETGRTEALGALLSTLATFDPYLDSSETPIGVRAEALSSTSARVSWTDATSDFTYSRQYTVRYISSTEDGGKYRYVNSTETAIVLDELQPNTLYEFAVRVSGRRGPSQWSMTAVNRTSAAPPSSAPRDLTVVQPASGDPHAVLLNWQPPKYGNGEIEEYIIYYSERIDLADRDWFMDSVKGDQLSVVLSNLLPRVSYFFKVQARNTKGYGPLSAALHYVPGANLPSSSEGMELPAELNPMSLLANSLYVLIATALVVFMTLSIILTFCFVKLRSSKSGESRGYKAGRRIPAGGKRPPDLWINHSNELNLRAADYASEPFSESMCDMKPYANGILAGTNRSSNRCQDTQANGSIARSYHQSLTSLESRRALHATCTTSRHQPIKKLESDQGSAYGSSQALQSHTPPPQLPNQGPPAAPPNPVNDVYRTLRSSSLVNNPLKSFAQLAGAPPPVRKNERAALIVRPVAVSSPSIRSGKPASIVVGHKSSNVPVGRATAQPRVNVNSIYGSYIPCPPSEKVIANCETVDPEHIQSSNSTEELNAQMENLDTMIDDLQALQHEFNVS